MQPEKVQTTHYPFLNKTRSKFLYPHTCYSTRRENMGHTFFFANNYE